MEETSKEQQVPNVYKTSKTTWFLIGFMILILIIIVFMMMRKKKDDGTSTEQGTTGGLGTTTV
jgi:preprotein translocase subunit SecG